MVAYTFVQRLTPNLALAGAGLAGALVALATLAIPGPLLESIVVTSGIAAFVPAAEPPLGVTARICVGVFAGGAVALIAWLLLSALLVWRDSREGGEVEEEGLRRPVVRRADAHPDAPPRPPLLATRDLGTPFMRNVEHVESESGKNDTDARIFASSEGEAEQVDAEVRDLRLPELPPEPVIAMGPSAPAAESIPNVHLSEPEVVAIEAPAPIVTRAPQPPAPQPLPADLDQPLSAFDPDAILDRPLAPPPPLAPLARMHSTPPLFAKGERFETFELTPQVRPASDAAMPSADSLAAPETDASVHALLDRLERGIVRRGQRPEPEPEPEAQAAPAPAPQPEAESEMPGLEGALAALRKLAVRA